MIGSGAKRRPNPPPRYMVLTFTLPGTTPATWARMPCAGPWDCVPAQISTSPSRTQARSEEHTSELQSQSNLVCRLLLEKKKTKQELCVHRSMLSHIYSCC